MMTRSPSTRTVAAGTVSRYSQQLLGEAAAGKPQVLELLGVGQAAHPVAHEDEVVLVHHPLRVVFFGAPKPSLMILKTH